MVNIHEAKTHFSKLVAEVEAGGEVVIARGGTPVARLVPYVEVPKVKRTVGRWRGRVQISPDFDEPDEELIQSFYADLEL